MTLYAGETIRISTTATEPDGTPITNANAITATIEIVDSSLASVISTNLVWEATEEYWYYDWDTPDTADTYQSRLRLATTDSDVWEYEKIKTKANKEGFVTP